MFDIHHVPQIQMKILDTKTDGPNNQRASRSPRVECTTQLYRTCFHISSSLKVNQFLKIEAKINRKTYTFWRFAMLGTRLELKW